MLLTLEFEWFAGCESEYTHADPIMNRKYVQDRVNLRDKAGTKLTEASQFDRSGQKAKLSGCRSGSSQVI
jgi:hypothetical protein